MKELPALPETLLGWIFKMSIDILESQEFRVQYRYVYYDKKRKDLVALVSPVDDPEEKRYHAMDACVYSEEKKIFISPTLSRSHKALCLFHECLEILFYEWKEDYFEPLSWGLEEGDDPIQHLEAFTWEKFTPAQKKAIQAFLPKEP